MVEITPLDQAHAAMDAVSAGDDKAALAFYGRLATSELFVLLRDEAQGETIKPEIFEVGDQTFLLAFDTETRLANFAERAVPYVAMSGRALAQMLHGQGTGIALNPEVAPSSMLLPPEAMSWLSDALAQSPSETEARISKVGPPTGLPETLITSLDSHLATTEGLAQNAYLVGVRYENGASGHLMGFVGALLGSETALARAVQEALVFSGVEAGAVDVAFFDNSDPMSAALARHGLRFELPQPETALHPLPPGMDPDKPPKLV